MKLPRVLISLLLLSFSVTACGGGSSSSGGSFSAGSFTTRSDQAEIAVEIDRFLIVPVVVNGVQGEFILDTGAESFAVSEAFAEKAGLESRGSSIVTTIAGSSEVEVVRMFSFELGNVVGANIDATVLSSISFDGVVGQPFFESVLVSIDYGNERIALADSSQFELSDIDGDSDAELFSMENYRLRNVMLGGVLIAELQVDTGNAGGFLLNSPEGLAVLSSAGETVSTTVTTANGSTQGTALIADAVLGGFSLPEQFVVVVSPNDEIRSVNLLGNLVMKQFTVGIDASRGLFLLRQERELRYGLTGE